MLTTGNLPKIGGHLATAETQLYRFFNQFNRNTQHHTIDNAKTNWIAGESNTLIELPARALVDAQGQSIHGQCDLHLRELTTLSDMIAASLPTTAQGSLFGLGQQIQVKAFQEGTPLSLARPIKIYFPVHNKKEERKQLFRGGYAKIQILNAGLHFDWIPDDTRKGQLMQLEGQLYRSFQVPALGWYAHAKKCPTRSKRHLSAIRLGYNTPRLEEVSGFLFFPELSALAYLHPNTQNFTALNIPTGVRAKAIIIGFGKGRYYFGSMEKPASAKQWNRVPVRAVKPEMLMERLLGVD